MGRSQALLSRLDALAQDLRRAIRLLRRSPAFTTVAVLSLALGIGVNTAMFSVINTVLLRAVPYPDASRLVRLTQQDGKSDVAMTELDIARTQTRAYAAVAGYRGGSERRLAWQTNQDWVATMVVTTDFLRTLGVRPALGREFTIDETLTSGPQAIVVSDSVWRRTLGADASVLGRTVTLDGQPFTIVGILPADFWLPQRTDALLPLRPSGGLGDLGTNTQIVARLRDDASLQQAQAELTTLIAAGLLMQSLYQMQRERLGFTPQGLVTFATPFDSSRLPTAADRARLTRELRERLEGIPGVRGVAATNVLPLAGRSNLPTQREGHAEQSIGGMEIRAVTSNYFELMGIPVRRGRPFGRDDVGGTAPVAIVNDTVARAWWSSDSARAIGDRLVIGLFQGRTLVDDAPREVVGVVGDTKTTTLKEPAKPTVFVPVEQALTFGSSLAWIVRTDGSPGLADRLRAAVAEVDRTQRVLQVRTMEEIVEETTATSRFNASLFGIFAGVALVLTVIGLYGVLSFLVSQRKQEIGTRMALGAGRANVLGLFLTQGLTLTVLGLGLGLAAAMLLTRWLSTLLYGVQPDDPGSFAAVAGLLLFVGLAASYLPARRAAAIDPMAALRSE